MLPIRQENYNLTEMASVCRVDNTLVAVNPDSGRVGDAYFKFCNKSDYTAATKLIRIFFKKADYTIHCDGKELWKLTNKEKKLLMQILKATSKRYKPYTNWDIAKYLWNCEYLQLDLDIDDYFGGVYDDEFKDRPSYVSSEQEIPNYMNLPI